MPYEQVRGKDRKTVVSKFLKQVDNFAQRVADDVRTNAIKNLSQGIFYGAVGIGAWDTGKLAGSIRIEKPEFLMRHVVVDSPYAQPVEFGSRAHWIPFNRKKNFDPLRDWVERKLKFKGAELNRVTYFIRKKIAKEGTPPRPFFRSAVFLVWNPARLDYLSAQAFAL